MRSQCVSIKFAANTLIYATPPKIKISNSLIFITCHMRLLDLPARQAGCCIAQFNFHITVHKHFTSAYSRLITAL